MAKIGIEAQRIFRKKKHGMDMVALELIRNLQTIDKKNEYFIYVKEDEDNQILEPSENFHVVKYNHHHMLIGNKYYSQSKPKKIISTYFIAQVIQPL